MDKRKSFILFLLSILLCSSYIGVCQAPSFIWAKGISNTGSSGSSFGIKTDAFGNSYVIGSFDGTADFDPSSNSPGDQLTSSGSNDIFLAKYDVSGKYRWAIRMGSAGHDFGHAIAIDGSGFIYITGYFNGIVDFNPASNATNTLTSAGGYDVFLAKYDKDGNYLWAINMGGNEGGDEGKSIAVSGDFIYITGNFFGTADFDPDENKTNIVTSNGGDDIFLAKYDLNGVFQWARSMGGRSQERDIGNSVAVDSDGNIYMTGYFNEDADFDQDPNTNSMLSSAGSYDIFLAKYNSSGDLLWAKNMGGEYDDVGNSIALDRSGNPYITGYFSATANFDLANDLDNYILTSAGNYDIFLAKYNSSGEFLWAKSMGGTGSDLGTGIALDGTGNPYITGYFEGIIDFDPGDGTAERTSSGNADIFLAMYNSSGIYQWAKSIGGTGIDNSNSITLDGSDNAFLTGNFPGKADFDPDEPVSNLGTIGSYNFFIAKYGEHNSLPITLLSFDAKVKNARLIQVDWATSFQQNNSYFEVQRSRNGQDFETVGKVNGCGDCQTSMQYSLDDRLPFSGKSYYRLKQVDYDGKSSFSKTVSVLLKLESAQGAFVYPNPGSGLFYLQTKSSGNTQKLLVGIKAINGVLVQQANVVLSPGKIYIPIDLSKQASGIYFIHISDTNGCESEMIKVIKE